MEAIMSDDDVKYFQRRAIEERERAESAVDPCARRAHQCIATEYERIAKANHEPTLSVVAS
jgi:hypothetical protein